MGTIWRKKGLLVRILIVNLMVFSMSGCYIDETINVGDGYGFSIGDTKQESFSKARKSFEGQVVYILSPINEQGFGPHKELEFSDDDYRLIVSRDTWEFHFDTGYRDSLTLYFSEGKLARIYRHKQSFELP
jgi:hypothetical protein